MTRQTLASRPSRVAPRAARRPSRSLAVTLGALGLVALSASGCRASLSANANINAGEEQETKDFDEPLTPVDRSLDEAPLEGDYALLGARHDVGLTDEAKKTASPCSCLALKLGQPTDPSFVWQGPIPRTDPSPSRADSGTATTMVAR